MKRKKILLAGSSRINVAHVITRMIVGGAQENTFLTVACLQRDPDYTVELITGCEIGPEGRLELSGINSVIFEPSLVRNINPFRDFLCFLRLILLFRRKKYHVVHTHSSKAGIIARLAAKAAGIPVIIHTIHGLPFHPYEKKMTNALFIFLEKLCSLFTDKIIVVAEQMKIKALEKNIGTEALYKTVYSGMYLDVFLKAQDLRDKSRKTLNIDSRRVVIGTIARLFPLKGHEFILAIAPGLVEAVPNILFLWVGNGILADSFREKICAMGLSKHFIFTGLVAPSEIPGYISAFDILVHTSLREGLARVLPQGLAAGVPVVSFDIDGASDLIKDGVNGFLVMPENKDMLKEKILILIKDPQLRNKFIDNGRKSVDPYFRHDYMVESIKEIYREFI